VKTLRAVFLSFIARGIDISSYGPVYTSELATILRGEAKDEQRKETQKEKLKRLGVYRGD